ncbi:MAG TPA: pyroglutamyl-peptidase I [Pseudolabrys sp.]|nr:pyroglutamyl-peptidase I [Pseudolabrys sp.]
MADTILITGFGPFPGAPFNPTTALARSLAKSRRPALADARLVAHVFATSYAAVDRELPVLLKRYQPRVLLMFGLAARTPHVRIETRARNAISALLPDVGRNLPVARAIAAGRPASLPLRAPARILLAAARRARVPAALSRDAGRYLCNYLFWRGLTAGTMPGGPQQVAFIHVPMAARSRRRTSKRRRLTADDLLRAGVEILRALASASRP